MAILFLSISVRKLSLDVQLEQIMFWSQPKQDVFNRPLGNRKNGNNSVNFTNVDLNFGVVAAGRSSQLIIQVLIVEKKFCLTLQ